jgi:hypothetical protein
LLDKGKLLAHPLSEGQPAMNSMADWMVVLGFLLLVAGVVLRVTMMMRSDETYSVHAAPATGRNLLRAFRTAHPDSKLPLLMWLLTSTGLVLLIGGVLPEFR